MLIETLSILLWIAAGGWGLFTAQFLLNALLVPNIARMRVAAQPETWPFVSYVVPARNEEASIGDAVTSFCEQNYPNFEVVVVNDRSTDRTGEILAGLQQKYENLVVVDGVEPPPDWLGKPNALVRGEKKARGDWILMADADSHHAPDLLRRAVACGVRDGSGMVTVRPQHRTEGFLEAVLMSGVNFLFFVVSPMFLVARTRTPLLATGSPVFNLIRRDAFEAVGGFGCLRQSVVDDLTIGTFVKKAGFRLSVLFSGEFVIHRMYDGAGATVQGFSKTTFPVIRKQPWLLPLLVASALTLSVLPYAGLALSWREARLLLPSVAALILMHVVSVGLVLRYREPWFTIPFSALRELGWIWVFVRSAVQFYRKGLVWRGRQYPQTR